jgi:hypothetical protein
MPEVRSTTARVISDSIIPLPPPYPPSKFSSYPQQSDENHFFFLLSFLNFKKFKYFKGGAKPYADLG